MGVLASIEEFVRAKTFHCERLNADLTPATCMERQKKQVEQVKRWGIRYNRSTDAQSAYCRSGECEQGHLVRLGTDGGRDSSTGRTTARKRDNR